MVIFNYFVLHSLWLFVNCYLDLEYSKEYFQDQYQFLFFFLLVNINSFTVKQWNLFASFFARGNVLEYLLSLTCFIVDICYMDDTAWLNVQKYNLSYFCVSNQIM